MPSFFSSRISVALGFRERICGWIHRRLVSCECACRLFFSSRRETDDASSAIGVVCFACHDPACFESIYRCGDGTAGKIDSTSDLLSTGCGPLWSSILHHREIREAAIG